MSDQVPHEKAITSPEVTSSPAKTTTGKAALSPTNDPVIAQETAVVPTLEAAAAATTSDTTYRESYCGSRTNYMMMQMHIRTSYRPTPAKSTLRYYKPKYAEASEAPASAEPVISSCDISKYTAPKKGSDYVAIEPECVTIETEIVHPDEFVVVEDPLDNPHDKIERTSWKPYGWPEKPRSYINKAPARVVSIERAKSIIVAKVEVKSDTEDKHVRCRCKTDVIDLKSVPRIDIEIIDSYKGTLKKIPRIYTVMRPFIFLEGDFCNKFCSALGIEGAVDEDAKHGPVIISSPGCLHKLATMESLKQVVVKPLKRNVFSVQVDNPPKKKRIDVCRGYALEVLVQEPTSDAKNNSFDVYYAVTRIELDVDGRTMFLYSVGQVDGFYKDGDNVVHIVEMKTRSVMKEYLGVLIDDAKRGDFRNVFSDDHCTYKDGHRRDTLYETCFQMYFNGASKLVGGIFDENIETKDKACKYIVGTKFMTPFVEVNGVEKICINGKWDTNLTIMARRLLILAEDVERDRKRTGGGSETN